MDLGERVQDVEFRETETRVVVYAAGVPQNDEIEPSAAPLAAGGDAPFAADALELCAGVWRAGFGGEGPGADAGGVGFYDADDGGDGEGGEGEAGEDPAETCGRRGYVGVGAPV